MTFERTESINVDDIIRKIRAENDAVKAIKEKYKVNNYNQFTRFLLFVRDKGIGYILSRPQLSVDFNITPSVASGLIKDLKRGGYVVELSRGNYELIKIPPVNLSRS